MGWLVHPEERRLRAPWRILVWFVSVLGFAIPAGLATWALRVSSLPLVLAIQAAAVLPPTLLVARFVDRRALAGLGLSGPWRTLPQAALGAVIGAGLIAGVAAVEQALGFARYGALSPEWRALGISIGVFALVALDEELVFRGYLLTNLAEAWGGERRVRGVVAATIVSSLVFGAAHLGNPGASVVPILSVTLAGFVLALPYVLTGELGLSLGLHFGWNLAQAWLGMAVSGNEVAGALARRELSAGAELWNGGAFGAEGGVLGLAALVVGALALWLVARRVRDERVADELGAPKARPLARAELVQKTEPRAHPVQALELGAPHPEDVLEHGHDARAEPGVRAEGPAVTDEPFSDD